MRCSFSSRSRFVVSVPVLSMHSTLTAAIDSTALMRWTTAPRAAIRIAPRIIASVAIGTRPCGTIEVTVAATDFARRRSRSSRSCSEFGFP